MSFTKTTVPLYWPIDYDHVAEPVYSLSTTHVIANAQAGLHTGFAREKVRKGVNQDLNKKRELVDTLSPGTEIIVFNEACGFKGQWSQVLVKHSGTEFYKYTDNEGDEVQRLFVMNEHLSRLSTIKPSHPIVDPESIVSPMYDVPPSNWRNESAEIPFFDNRTGKYSIIVEHLIDHGSPDAIDADVLKNYMRAAAQKGTKLLLDYYQKEYPDNLVGDDTTDTSGWDDGQVHIVDGVRYDEYFSFARAEGWHIEARRHSSAIKILVQIPQIYFDTYEVKKESKAVVEIFHDAEDNVNKFLDENNGALNTDIIRDMGRSWFADDDGELPEAFLNDEMSLEIYGETVVFVEEDALGRTIFSPNEIAAATEERIAQLNDSAGDMLGEAYKRYIPGETRDAIEQVIEAVREAYTDVQDVTGDVTASLQSTINIINTVIDTLGAAPDYDTVNDAMFTALTDPTVATGDISEVVLGNVARNEAAKRILLDRDLRSVIQGLQGEEANPNSHWKKDCFILEKYNQLLTWYDHAEATTATSSATSEDVKKLLVETETTMKQIEFYVKFNAVDFYSGTLHLQKILEHLEEQKDQFEGKVEGWIPDTDSKRIPMVYDKITNYISEQGQAQLPRDIYGNRAPLWTNFNKDFNASERNSIEFGFTRNHQLIYVGCRFNPYPRRPKLAMTIHRYGESFESFSQRTIPFESQTIMAYIWKLNDIIRDEISQPGMYDQRDSEGESLTVPLVSWGSKYVYPRPKFIAKPRPASDVSEQIAELGKELTKLQTKKDRDTREDGQLRIQQAVQAVNEVEHFADSAIGDANSVVKNINSADDAINNYFAGVATMNPYAAAAIKCLVPKLDFDLLPEIPDLDLEWLRNPLMKILELWETIVPPGDIWDAYKKALIYAFEQAMKLAYVTLVKLLLESLAAACLQAQAALMAAVLDPVGVYDLLTEGDKPSPETVISNLDTEQDSIIVGALHEAGLFSSTDLDMPEAIRLATALFTDISGLLTPVELCYLVSGEPPEYILNLIINLIARKHRKFIDVIDSKSKIIKLFSVLGQYIDQQLCNEIVSENEDRTIFSDNYKNLSCNISSELDRVRKQIMECETNLTNEEIDAAIHAENVENLKKIEALVKTFNSDTIDILSAFDIQSAASDYADVLAIETMFQASSEALKRELKEYAKYLTTIAEISVPISQGDVTVLQVISGERRMEQMPKPTEIAGLLRHQLNKIEVGEGPASAPDPEAKHMRVLRMIESDDGFILKLISPWQWYDDWSQPDKKIFETAAKLYNIERKDNSFEMRLQFHNKYEPEGEVEEESSSLLGDLGLPDFSGFNNLGDIPNKYSLIIRDPKANSDIFMYSKEYEPKIETKEYIWMNLPGVNLKQSIACPQQVYFQTFLESKMGASFTSESAREHFKLFVQYGIFFQITRDVLAFLGRKIADSKYFKFSNETKNSKLLSNLELADLPSRAEDLFGLKKITTDATDLIKKNQKYDLPEPSDATVQRQHYNAFEVGCIDQCIKAIIRVYIVEFLVKSIFSSSAFQLPGQADEIFHDYILQKIKLDLPVKFSQLFNYKFNYLCRGIHQDNLEGDLEAADHDIDHILTEHIKDQYVDVSKVFNEIMDDSLTSGTPIFSEGSEDIEDVPPEHKADAGITDPESNLELLRSTNEFLNDLPIKDFVPGRSYNTPADFIGEDGDKLKDGNFYFERYLKITRESPTPEVQDEISFIGPNDLQDVDGVTAIDYGLRLMYLFPYDDVTKRGVQLTTPDDPASPYGHQTPGGDQKFSIDLETIIRSAPEKLLWNEEAYNYAQLAELQESIYTGGVTSEMTEEEMEEAAHQAAVANVLEQMHFATGLQRYGYVAEVARTELPYEGRIDKFFGGVGWDGGYNIYGGKEIIDFNYELVWWDTFTVENTYAPMNDHRVGTGTGGTGPVYGGWSLGEQPTGNETAEDFNHESTIMPNIGFAEALKRKLPQDIGSVEALTEYFKTRAVGIGLLINDTDGDTETYWSSGGIPGEVIEDHVKEANNTLPMKVWGIDRDPQVYIQPYENGLMTDNDSSIGTYIDTRLESFYSQMKSWLKNGSANEGKDIDIERIEGWANVPVLGYNIVGKRHPDDELRTNLNYNPELNFLFNYIFPVEKYKTLLSIYSIESMGDIPGLESMFSETKAELRSLFNLMDSRGRFNYVDPTKEKNIDLSLVIDTAEDVEPLGELILEELPGGE